MIKALVIDDEKAFTEIAAGFMSGFCQVETAESAEEGLSKLQSLLPDIVVVDNQLPGLKGVDFVRRIRSSLETVIVMVTIDKEEEVQAALRPETVDFFLRKPFRRSDLEKCLLEAIVVVKRKKGTGQ